MVPRRAITRASARNEGIFLDNRPARGACEILFVRRDAQSSRDGGARDDEEPLPADRPAARSEERELEADRGARVAGQLEHDVYRSPGGHALGLVDALVEILVRLELPRREHVAGRVAQA